MVLRLGHRRPYSLSRIAAGDHEMNGGWYPWAEQVNGNAPGNYVRAWHHVVDVFRAASVRNVTWVWSPNVPYPGSTALASLYPGDAYVDRVALDGYNWADFAKEADWRIESSPASAAAFRAGLADYS